MSSLLVSESIPPELANSQTAASNLSSENLQTGTESVRILGTVVWAVQQMFGRKQGANADEIFGPVAQLVRAGDLMEEA